MREKKKREPNYEYIVADNKVICISRYAKKAVRGIAKCAPDDSFDVETGKKLAKLRCDLKVAEQRYKNAKNRMLEAEYYYALIEDEFNAAAEKMIAADEELSDILEEYDKLRSSL